MAADEDRIREAAERTKIVRLPRQSLATFGTTVVDYFLVTEAIYAGIAGAEPDSVVRRGTVKAERPRVITASYLVNAFAGFEHGDEFARLIRSVYGLDAPGLMYRYHQQLDDTDVVASPVDQVAAQLAQRLDHEEHALGVVLIGLDHLWDVALMRFIHDWTLASAGHNLVELEDRGLLANDRGVPRAGRAQLDEMFDQVRRGELDPTELKAELDRWGLFREYEDRFLDLFRR
ncbi:MAG: hypothetical protein HY329_21790 [Chloroflexi bacterium]|nr:hypothetical protein [Chloroflexota bacterium]